MKQPTKEEWAKICRMSAELFGYCEKTGATATPQLRGFFDSLGWAIDRFTDFEEQTK